MIVDWVGLFYSTFSEDVSLKKSNKDFKIYLVTIQINFGFYTFIHWNKMHSWQVVYKEKIKPVLPTKIFKSTFIQIIISFAS